MKAKVDPSLQSLSGRWSKKDITVIALNKKTGKMHQYQMNDDPKYPNTESQQAVKSAFKTRSLALAAWWNENKPSTTNTNGSENYQKLIRNFDAQANYGNKFCYARSLVDDDLKLHIGTTVIDLSGTGGGSGSGSGGGNDDGGGAIS